MEHDYKERIEAHRDEIIAMLQEFLKIKSVQSDSKEGKPFGAGVQEAYEYFLAKGQAEDLSIFNADNYGGHLQWSGVKLDEQGNITAAADETLGIPVHLDVVPEGGEWTRDAFGGTIEDGKIYGRGTTDNKGSAVAVFHAIKALKDSGFVPSKNVRVILGLDEETGWSGMVKYLEAAGPPDFGFVPDAEFPAINGEKGVLTFELAKKLEKSNSKGIVLRSLEGGVASNMVPDHARAIILDEINKNYDGVKEKIAAYREKTGYRIYGKGIGKAFEISVKGVSAHGAQPWTGQNAVSILIEFLDEIGPANESVRDFINFYREHLGFELDGTGMGIGFSDEPSGKLVLNVGKIEMNPEAVILTINIRYPVTFTEDQIYDAMMPLVHKYDLGVVKGSAMPVIFFPADDPFIETLMDVYRENTGDLESKPLVIGGGTYARAIPNAVAFGPLFPGRPDLMHKKDEYITADDLILITKIYADAIYRLTASL